MNDNLKFFHTLENGTISKQGMIISKNKTTARVQLFSWIDGEPTDEITVPLEELKEWIFYKTQGDWLHVGDNLFKMR